MEMYRYSVTLRDGDTDSEMNGQKIVARYSLGLFYLAD